MAKFSDLYDHILPYLPGAETGIVDFHIRRVLREFFKRTTVWRETFSFDTTAGMDTYQLQPSAGIVASVLDVLIDGQRTEPVPEAKRDPLVAAQKPYGWYNLLPQVMTLYPAPDAAYPVKVTAAITLAIDAGMDFPDDVLQSHAEPIAAGVIGGMMMMPGKPWTQRQSALDYSTIYSRALRDLRGRLRDGGQPNQSTFVAARRFGA